MHPKFIDLLTYMDGELGDHMALRVAEHLVECAKCAGEVERLWVERHAFAAMGREDAEAVTEGLDRLLERMRNLQNALAAERMMRRRTIEQLRTYFGSVAGGLVGEIEQNGLRGEKLEARAEPLFAAYLGRAAAQRVMSDIRSGLDLGMVQ
jgi:anti-sigma factor RsiW